MKPIFFLLLLTACNGCGSGTNQDKKSYSVSVYTFVDITDAANYEFFKSHFEEYSAEIASAYRYETGDKGTFSIAPINNLGENPFQRVTLQPIPDDKTDEQVKNLQKSFRKGIFDKFEQFLKATPVAPEGLNSTKVYAPLCNLLEELTEESASRKIVVLFSDMLENSDLYRLYQDDKNANPAEALEKMAIGCGCKLPDLDDVEIYIVSGREAATDKVINHSKQFWKFVFKENNEAKIFRFKGDLRIKEEEK